MDFSIVIPTWNRSKLVDALLKSLYEERRDYTDGETEVLIVDSSRGEEKASIVESCSKYDAQYIEGDDSVRKKRNKGIDLAKYEYILFIDSDVTVRPGLLRSHAATLSTVFSITLRFYFFYFFTFSLFHLSNITSIPHELATSSSSFAPLLFSQPPSI